MWVGKKRSKSKDQRRRARQTCFFSQKMPRKECSWHSTLLKLGFRALKARNGPTFSKFGRFWNLALMVNRFGLNYVILFGFGVQWGQWVFLHVLQLPSQAKQFWRPWGISGTNCEGPLRGFWLAPVGPGLLAGTIIGLLDSNALKRCGEHQQWCGFIFFGGSQFWNCRLFCALFLRWFHAEEITLRIIGLGTKNLTILWFYLDFFLVAIGLFLVWGQESRWSLCTRWHGCGSSFSLCILCQSPCRHLVEESVCLGANLADWRHEHAAPLPSRWWSSHLRLARVAVPVFGLGLALRLQREWVSDLFAMPAAFLHASVAWVPA